MCESTNLFNALCCNIGRKKRGTFVFLLLTQVASVIAQSTITVRLTDNVPYNSKVGTLKNLDPSLPPLPAEGYDNVVLTAQNDKLKGFFDIDKQTTISASRDVDRDDICQLLLCCEIQECNLFYSAQINTKEGHTLNRNVQIILPDENDNRPTFPSLTPIDILENTTVGSSNIPLPLATDKDSMINSVKSYSLTDSSGTFSLVMKSERPYLMLLKPLDRESIPQYQVSLHASDGRYDQSAVLTIRIEDINDNPPILVRNDIAETISESVLVGTKITTLLANDQDSGKNGELIYNISSVQPEELKDHFTVDYRGFWGIYLQKPLDYENPRERQATLTIVVTDKGVPPRSAEGRVRITLTDANDNPPVIEELQRYMLLEHTAANTLVKTIKVTDPDSVSKDKVTCKIESNPKFKLERNTKTGGSELTEQVNYNLYSTTSFDYEVSQKETVTITCLDSASPDKVASKIFDIPIKETNDFKPEFKKKNYYVQVYENLAVGRSVLIVEATDEDKGQSGEVFYELDSIGMKNFSVVRDTGMIEVKYPLDREKTKSLKFHVIARDKGEKSFNDTAAVIVELLDVNDSPPKYEGPNIFHVEENSKIGTQIGVIKFSDDDEGENGTVESQLMRDSNNIGSHNLRLLSNGSLVVDKLIDRENTANFFVVIRANDMGRVERLTTTRTIQVVVEDVNDNAPTVTKPEEGLKLGMLPVIYTDIPKNSLLVTIAATDPDNGRNGTIIYQLRPTNASSLLQIEPTKGEIYTSWDPDVSPPMAGLYQVSLLLSDKGTPNQRSSTRTFYVKLTSPPGLLPRFGTAGISGLVILIIIIVGTIAIAMGLIAAICWVRGRSIPQSRSDATDFDARTKMSEDFRDYRDTFSPDPHQTILKPGSQVDYVSWPRPGSPLHKDEHDQIFIRRTDGQQDYYPMEHMTRSNYTFLGQRSNGNHSHSPRPFQTLTYHPPHPHPHHHVDMTLHERRHSEDASVDDSGRGGSVEDVKTGNFNGGPLTLPRSSHNILLKPDPTAKGTMI